MPTTERLCSDLCGGICVFRRAQLPSGTRISSAAVASDLKTAIPACSRSSTPARLCGRTLSASTSQHGHSAASQSGPGCVSYLVRLTGERSPWICLWQSLQTDWRALIGSRCERR